MPMKEGNSLSDGDTPQKNGVPMPTVDVDAFPDLEMNPNDYLESFKEWAISEEEKIEFLECWWNILISFHELSIDGDSVQLALHELFDKAGQDSDKLLEIKNINNATEGD